MASDCLFLFVVFISIPPARSAFYPKQACVLKIVLRAVLGWRWEREFWQDHLLIGKGKKIRNI